MKRRVYRSLDRPATFFGVRGRFMVIFGLGFALALIIAMIVGGMTSMLVGFGVLLLICVAVYMTVISLQERISEKDLFKLVIRRRFPDIYRVQPKHIRNIWKGFNLPNHNLTD